MLSNYVLPQLHQLPDCNSLIFMQDGNLPHHLNSVRNLLNTFLVVRSVDAVKSSGPLDHPILRLWIFSCGCYERPSSQQQTRSLDDLKMIITTQFNANNSNKE